MLMSQSWTAHTRQVIADWLHKSAATATNAELDAHMALISTRVQVYGVPDFDVINYDAWRKQCESEFSSRLITSVHYGPPTAVESKDGHITFRCLEYIQTSEGQRNASGIEVELTLEADGQWRLTQERILDEEEVNRYQLIPS